MSEDQFNGAVKEAVGHVQDAAGGLVGDAKLQADGKVNEAAGGVQQAYGKVKDKADAALHQAKDKADAALHQAKDKAQDIVSEVETYTREKPLTALGIGLGVGVVLGVLLAGGGRTVYVRGGKSGWLG
jgi:ElaB/YqjD/DUF883 family membrane-anchored ribosome-binding protein